MAEGNLPLAGSPRRVIVPHSADGILLAHRFYG